MRPRNIAGHASAAAVALVLAACTPPYLPPQQVQASNPTVTYKYNDDSGLLQVNQSATTFCNQYRAAPRPASFANNQDGSKTVIFECVQPAMQMATPAPYNPNLTYNYTSDPELLTASQNAQAYCLNNGSQQVISNITTNPNGTRTVTFQCSRS